MLTTTFDRSPTSTTYSAQDNASGWADIDHPDFYFDPDFKAYCHQRLAELAKLAPNWDNDGAPAINPDVLAAVARIVDQLPNHLATRPMFAPLASGSVQLEWHHGRRVLELEFETPNTIHFLQWDPEVGLEEEAVFPAHDVDRAVGLVRWFMKGFHNG